MLRPNRANLASSPPSRPRRRGSSSSAAGTTTSATKTTPAPEPGATAAEALAWVQGAGPVDAAEFHVALRNGEGSTPLADDVAFTTPSGISCMTDVKRGGGLACQVLKR